MRVNVRSLVTLVKTVTMAAL